LALFASGWIRASLSVSLQGSGNRLLLLSGHVALRHGADIPLRRRVAAAGCDAAAKNACHELGRKTSVDMVGRHRQCLESLWLAFRWRFLGAPRVASLISCTGFPSLRAACCSFPRSQRPWASQPQSPLSGSGGTDERRWPHDSSTLSWPSPYSRSMCSPGIGTYCRLGRSTPCCGWFGRPWQVTCGSVDACFDEVRASNGSLLAAVPAGRDGDDAIRRSPDEMFNHLERTPSSGGCRDSTAWRD
jgi:hypothetical protein